MKKRLSILFFFILSVFLLFPAFTAVTVRAAGMRSSAVRSGTIQIENRDDTGGAFACDVKLSGGTVQGGSVLVVLYAESGQMKGFSDYPAAETVRVMLSDVAATDYVKILWVDGKYMPVSDSITLRMSGNKAAAYERFRDELAETLRLSGEGSAESASSGENPYALARLLVSCKTLPDLSDYEGRVQVITGPDDLYVLQFSNPGEVKKCEDYLRSSRFRSNVRYVEPDAVIRADDTDAWSGSGTGADGKAFLQAAAAHSWGVEKTGIGEYADNLRQREISRPVTVAVVDSGVDTDHSFLRGRLLPGYDFVQYDELPEDENGHGTHVAGTVVDCTSGMDVQIMPVRVLNAFGYGSLSSIALGIRYAADHGANIINLSLGLMEHSDAIEDAITDALSKNVTVVVAAGNKNGNAAFYCPAHREECITVAAVDSDLKRFDISNYGNVVDVAAPGVKIESSYHDGGFCEMSGTSMAAPHVSAAAALLMTERGTGQTPLQISSLLRSEATVLDRDPDDLEWRKYRGDGFLGSGFLNMRPFVLHELYALLYTDGEMVFQKNDKPASGKTLVKSYPAAAAGAGGAEYAAWYENHAQIRTVTFAESIQPQSTAQWFYGCENLSEIRGLDRLDTSKVADMSQMFARCTSLQTLDLSGWDTSGVNNMSMMFFDCTALERIYTSGSFSVGNVSRDLGMFGSCTSLVGGSGTAFDPNHTDAAYAHIDGGASNPGYFTDKNAPTLTPTPTNSPTPTPIPDDDDTKNMSADELFHLGEDYFSGQNGKPQDYKKSIYYYERSAEKGNMYAMNDLGYIYQHGYGTAVDYAKALRYYEQAAELGNPHALNNLGYVYENGLGVRQDFQKAIEYYNRAIAGGSENAANNLLNLRIRMLLSGQS